MKRYSLVCLLTLGLTLGVKAQQPEGQTKITIRLNCGPPLTTSSPPLVLVNEQETTADAIILNLKDIESINVLKGAEAEEQFAAKGKNGVIILEMKKERLLARLEEVYEAFKVPKKQQKLTVAINGSHVKDPALLLADLRQIEKIEISGFETAPSRWTFDEHYLNIVTKPQH